MKSTAYRLTVFGSAIFVFFLLMCSIGLYLYITRSQEQCNLEVTLKALQYRRVYDIHYIQPELVTLSSKSIDFKIKVLSAVLQDTLDSYGFEIIPYLSHTLIGISPKNQEKLIDFSQKSISPRNIFKFLGLFSTGLDSLTQKKATHVLLNLLQKTHDIERQKRVVSAFGVLGPAAVQPLIRLLQETQDIDLQKGVADALKTIGPAAAPAIQPLIKLGQETRNPDLQERMADALRAIGPAAVQPLIKLLQETRDTYLQRKVADALMAIGPAEVPAVQPLIKLLQETRDPVLQRYVANALGAIGPAAVQPLIKLLQETRCTYLQWGVVDALGAIGPAAAPAVQPLIELLQETRDTGIQGRVAAALEAIGPAAAPAVQPLIKLLQETHDPEIQTYIAKALGAIGPAAVQPLIKMLQETQDTRLQWHVTSALGQIGPVAKHALPELDRIFHARNNYVTKYCIATAMLKIDPDNTEYLKNMIEVVLPHPIVGYENREEIIKLVGQATGKEATGEKLDFSGDMWKMIAWWEKRKKS